jgi:hypothetical protein
MKSRHYYPRLILIAAVSVLALGAAGIAYAAPLYVPGQTLDPQCLPNNPDCTVATSTPAVASTSPTVAYITATSTTATSNFANTIQVSKHNGTALQINAGNSTMGDVSNIDFLNNITSYSGIAGQIQSVVSDIGYGSESTQMIFSNLVQGTLQPTMTLGTISDGTPDVQSNCFTYDGVNCIENVYPGGSVVASNLSLTGALNDSLSSPGSNGSILQSTGSAVKWVATSSIISMSPVFNYVTAISPTDTSNFYGGVSIKGSGTQYPFIMSAFQNGTGGGYGSQDLYILGSNDATNWTSITGTTPIPLDNGNIRDAHIIQWNGIYYLSYTSDASPANYFGMATSSNLTTWSSPIYVNTGLSVPNTWSPRPFIDSSNVLHIFFTAGTDHGDFDWQVMQLYEMHMSSASPLSFSPPVKLTGSALASTMLDPDMNYINGVYYLFYKDENMEEIELATSSSMTSGFNWGTSGDWAGWGDNAEEGPDLIKLPNSNTYRLYFSGLGSGHYYSDSSNFLNGSGGTWTGSQTLPTGGLDAQNTGVLAVSPGNLSVGGNVGIGTTSPFAALSVENDYLSTNATIFSVASSTSPDNSAASNLFSISNTGVFTSSTTNSTAATSTVKGNLYVTGTLRSKTSYNGDLFFANNFSFSEANMATDTVSTSSPMMTQGLLLKNQYGSTTLSIDENGNLTVGGDICGNGEQCFGKSISALSSDMSSLASSTNLSILSATASTGQSLSELSASVSSTSQSLALISVQLDALSSTTAILQSALATSTIASSTASALTANQSFIQTIAATVQSLIQSAGNWVLNQITATLGIFDRVQTKELCVDDTCITGDQLKQILQKEDVAATTLPLNLSATTATSTASSSLNLSATTATSTASSSLIVSVISSSFDMASSTVASTTVITIATSPPAISTSTPVIDISLTSSSTPPTDIDNGTATSSSTSTSTAIVPADSAVPSSTDSSSTQP